MNKKDKLLKVSIKTFGCQMNDYDSELALGLLSKNGYESTADTKLADLVLFNTCSVRQQGEDRVFGQLSQLKKTKRERPDLMIGVMGCMVESYKERFFADYPHVDFLIGTRSIKELPETIAKVRSERKQIAQLSSAGFGYELFESPRITGKIHAQLPIMTGCDKVCSFCIVPYVRGREISRAPEDILHQVRQYAAMGIKCVTLLGQNVNSYASKLGPGTEKRSIVRGKPTAEGENNFAVLLENVCKIDGIERVSFTTSHPQDAYEELFQVIRRNPKISRRFHLPLQSGSDRILARMKREHTLAEYRVKVDRMRELIPDITITTDIIVGFPGEEEADFQMTRDALDQIKFDGAFIYRYSPRPHTAAALWDDIIPDEEKLRKVTELLTRQKAIAREENLKWLGRTVKVMIEEPAKRNSKEVLARSWSEKKVVLAGDLEKEMGSVIEVKLTELIDATFRAERVS